MRNASWIALASVALAVCSATSRAEEPAKLPDPIPPAATATTPEPIAAPAADAVAATPGPSCSGEGCSSCCNGGCQDCGKRQRKVARCLDWLIYVPLDHGKTKCCGCQAAPPPAWAFFPCQGCGQASTCAVAASATMYYAKAPGTATPNHVVETAYPAQAPQTPQAPAAAQPPRVSTFNSQSVQPRMPVLDPAQYRKPANPN